MEKTPLVSVLLPVYNAEAYIEESLRSILNQSMDDFELLIIDDGSFDRSKEIIMSVDDKRIIYLENKVNSGVVKALNKGLFFSKGKYVARMDADDVCSRERFEMQVAYLSANEHIDILGTSQYIIGKSVDHSPPLFWEELQIRLLLEPVVGHSTVMMNKAKIKERKLFYDKSALHAEDYKLWVDASLNGLKIEKLAESLCGYRHHPNSVSAKYKDVQDYTAHMIRLSYAKYFFEDIININEYDYLTLIMGSKAETLSNVVEIAEKLIAENNKQSHFNPALFCNFINQRLSSQYQFVL